MPGHDVDFTLGATVVVLDDGVATFPEELAGQSLTEGPRLSPLHLPTMSRTGWKERRWMAQGPSLRRQTRCSRVPYPL